MRNDSHEDSLASGNEITFARMFGLVIAGWQTIAGSVAVCVLLALLSLATSRPVYTATMVVAPVPQDTGRSSNTSALTGVLGVLSGGFQTDDIFKRYQGLYPSVALAQRLQQRHHTLQTIYRSNWDSEHKRWIDRPNWRRLISAPLNLLAGQPTWTAPTTVDLAAYLEDAVLVRSTLRNDFVRISYTSPDPVFAVQLLRQMHEAADDLLREQAANRARQKVTYLEEKLATTNVADYRQTLLGLLAEQQKLLLLTQPGTTYAAELVDGPVSSTRPTSPKPVIMTLIAIIAGFGIGIVICLTWGPVTREQLGKLRNLLRLPRRRRS